MKRLLASCLAVLLMLSLAACGSEKPAETEVPVTTTESPMTTAATEVAETEPVRKERAYRRVPMSRLLSRLGLTAYNKTAPLSEEIVVPSQLKVLLSQHIGAPSVPLVKAGDTVAAGQPIAAAAENALSVGLNAPLGGVIKSVTDKVITIDVKEG